jgi:hypothetical protein
MNLEHVEQKSLSYLKQVTNPLVPMEQLLAHLQRDEECASLTSEELLAFLERHELFKVVEPIGIASNLHAAKELEEAGVTFGPRVILCTRVPTAAQLAEQIREEMERLTNALQKAIAEAKRTGDADKARALIKVLSRAQNLQERLDDMT